MKHAFRIYCHGLLVGARDFAIFWNWKTWCGGWMMRILTNVFVWVLLGRLLGSAEKLHYLMVGFAATAGVGTFAVAAASWDRLDGTYSLLVIAPSSIAPALFGRMSIWMFGWIASAVLTFFIVTLAFHWTFSAAAVAITLAIIVLICVTTFFLTVAVGAVASLAPRIRNMCSFFVTLAIMAFCGVSVPVSFWPRWLQIFCNLLPVTHGLEAIRLVLGDGGSAADILRQVGLEILVGLGWLGLSLLIVDRFAEAGRADGTIELV
jgi:ABC-2 type transport system permease protein